MKILLIHPNFTNNPDVVGGSELIAYHTYDMLKERGHEVFYFAENNPPLYDKNYKYKDKLVPFKQGNRNILNYFYNFTAQKYLEKMIAEIQPDIVHIHMLGKFTHSIIDTLHTKKIPIVMTIHDANIACPTCYAWDKRLNKECFVKKTCNLFKCLFRTCTPNNKKLSSILANIKFLLKQFGHYDKKIMHYITPSTAIKDLMIKAGYEKEKITVINNFVTEDYLTEIIEETSLGSYFLYSGRLTSYKGIYTLIKAMELLPRDISLHIAGTGIEFDKISQVITEKCLTNIKVLGYLTQYELKREYANCIATIVPSEYFEAFGLINIEAFCFSKPIISTGVGGIKEIVEDGVNGYLYTPQNEHELAQKILFLWHNKELAKQMGKISRESVLKKYTDKIYLTNLENLYSSLLSK